tara:strand:+ start:134 stop:364 length:231 start_codon:yes stop_codon:yes gene_type:complete
MDTSGLSRSEILEQKTKKVRQLVKDIQGDFPEIKLIKVLPVGIANIDIPETIDTDEIVKRFNCELSKADTPVKLLK